MFRRNQIIIKIKNMSMQETRDFLSRIGMPTGDLYSLPTSEKRFDDGGQYRFEVPGIQAPGTMKALLEALDEYGIQIHRVTQTKGIWTLLDSEIAKMVRIPALPSIRRKDSAWDIAFVARNRWSVPWRISVGRPG